MLINISEGKDIPVHFGKIIQKGVIKIDNLENIGSNKILAILGRNDAKDFIDLYLILTKTKLKFDYLYNLAKQKDLGLSEFYLANSIRQIKEIKIYPQMLKQFNEDPSTLRSGYLLPTLRRERNPSEAKNSSLQPASSRPRCFAKGDKTQMLKFYDSLSKKLLAKIKPKE